ncbi:MAG: PLP-dependent aminotransferase family protein [Chloroflexota bacterium]|nr:MAG: transcriptional regulator [Chloroflexi bacterium OLB13]MEB2365530.1 PLP-dependent aminotransferase family protein [Chloroflexota bacterium]GIK28898.1 MAG: GntR family transcriptional regulator [Chloroflexota bacterium]
MIVPVDVDSTKPLYLQIADHITMLAVGGQLGGGTRLPASRQLAESLQVHRSTVVNAYEELKARGVIDATQGSGSYVVPGLVVSSRQAPAIMPALREPDDIVRMLWRVNRADGVISLALGLPADELMPIETYEAARSRALRRDRAEALNYEDPSGYEPLRRAIAGHLAKSGAVVDPENVIVTVGAQEALNLTARALATYGDTVLVEAPGFFLYTMNLKRLGYNVLGYRLRPSGPDWASLAGTLCQTTVGGACDSLPRPRFVLASPDFQNPTGSHWSADDRHRFVDTMQELDLQVIEDATYRDLVYDGAPQMPLLALDDDVIHIGTFSKVMMPALRIGYIVARGALREQLITLRNIACGSAYGLAQRAVTEMLVTGQYDEHVRRIQAEYRVRRDALCAALDEYMPDEVQFEKPMGGFYVWLRLPEQVNAVTLFTEALQRGIAVAPSHVFYPDGLHENAVRLSFARYNADTLRYAAKRLADLVHHMMR